MKKSAGSESTLAIVAAWTEISILVLILVISRALTACINSDATETPTMNPVMASNRRRLELSMTVPMIRLLSFGVSIPTSVIASVARAKRTKSEIESVRAMYCSREPIWSFFRGNGL